MCQGTEVKPLPVPGQTHFEKQQSNVIITKERLDGLLRLMVRSIKDSTLGKGVNHKNVLSKMFGAIPELQATVVELREQEDSIQREIFQIISKLMCKTGKFAAVPPLIKQGLLKSDMEGEEIDSPRKREHFSIACLDLQDRLRMMVEAYGWEKQFFRQFPVHEHEAAFRFNTRKDPKPPKVKVHVVGMGIGGGFVSSGLAKRGCEVKGFEKRNRRDVASRFQTASWTMYESANELLDDEGYDELNHYRQAIHFTHKDGVKSIFTNNRCTIILGGAVETGIKSAERMGVDVRFETSDYVQYREKIAAAGDDEEPDIVALFCGTHTGSIFGVEDHINLHTWPQMQSNCYLWLQMQESEHTEEFTARRVKSGGPEKWRYCILSARDDLDDIERVIDNLKRQHKRNMAAFNNDDVDVDEVTAVISTYEKQLKRMEDVKKSMIEGNTKRYDYDFTTAPVNEINEVAKADAADSTMVMTSNFSIVPTFAFASTFTDGPMTEKFKSKMVVCGGDSCVAPNPLAARGATVACNNGMALVNMALGNGHLDIILKDMNHHNADKSWIADLEHLKALLPKYYDAVVLTENYFQWLQTIAANTYSMPNPPDL